MKTNRLALAITMVVAAIGLGVVVIYHYEARASCVGVWLQKACNDAVACAAKAGSGATNVTATCGGCTWDEPDGLGGVTHNHANCLPGDGGVQHVAGEQGCIAPFYWCAAPDNHPVGGNPDGCYRYDDCEIGGME